MRILFLSFLLLLNGISFGQNYLKLTNIHSGKSVRIRQGARIEFQVKTGDPNSFPVGTLHKGTIDLITDSMVVINGYGVPIFELVTIKKSGSASRVFRAIGTGLAPITLRIGGVALALGTGLLLNNEPVLGGIITGVGVVFTAAGIAPFFIDDPRTYELQHEWKITPVTPTRYAPVNRTYNFSE